MSDRFFPYDLDRRWRPMFTVLGVVGLDHSALWVSVADPEGLAAALA